jgi:hypothetical protein
MVAWEYWGYLWVLSMNHPAVVGLGSKEVAMHYLRCVPICILLALLAAACGSDCPTESSSGSELPLAVGSHWAYWRYDSLGTKSDTIDVRIVAKASDARGDGVFWDVVIRGADRTSAKAADFGQNRLFSWGRSFVVARRDSIIFFKENGTSPYLLLLVPLKEGDRWAIPTDYGSDSTIFAGLDTVVTPVGEFRGTRRLTESSGYFDCFWSYRHWFQPGVGYVKSRRKSSAWLCGDRSLIIWELVADQIP